MVTTTDAEDENGLVEVFGTKSRPLTFMKSLFNTSL